MEATLFAVSVGAAILLGQVLRFTIANGVSILPLDAIVVVFSGVSFVKLLFQKKLKEVVRVSLFKPICFFFGACVVSLLVNIPQLRSEELLVASLYLLRFLAYTGILLFVPLFLNREKKFLQNALVASLGLTVILGFVQFFYYPNLRNLYYLEWDDHLYRLFSVYLDPNFAGVLFACLFVFLLGSALMRTQISKKNAVLFYGAAFFPLLAVFLTYSRTGMLTLVVGTAVLLFVMRMRALFLVFLFIFSLLLIFTADLKVEGLNPFRTVSTNARIESARIALTIFSRNPFFGVGYNAYRYAQHRYGFRPDDRWETSHADAGTDNSFLFVLGTTGIVGIGFYLYFWFFVLKNAYKFSKKAKKTQLVVLFPTAVAVLASSLFLNTLFYPFVLVWFFSLYATMENT